MTNELWITIDICLCFLNLGLAFNGKKKSLIIFNGFAAGMSLAAALNIMAS